MNEPKWHEHKFQQFSNRPWSGAERRACSPGIAASERSSSWFWPEFQDSKSHLADTQFASENIWITYYCIGTWKKVVVSRFNLLVKDGLGLTSVTWLFAVVPTLSLSSKAILALLVLSDLVQGVLPALLALAVRLLSLRNVHLQFAHNVYSVPRYKHRKFNMNKKMTWHHKVTELLNFGTITVMHNKNKCWTVPKKRFLI